jgi:two-component system cell cycle sensor histidine kinase/response regulator CckA
MGEGLLRVSRTPEEWESLARRLDALVSTLTAGVIETDVSGRLVFANAAAERMLGLADTAYLGRTADELGIVRHDSAGRQVEHRVGAWTAAGRESVHSVYRYSGPGFPDLWLEGDTVPLFSATGELTGTVDCFMDVTARFQAARRAADARLDDILRHTAVGVLMVDPAGRIEYANAAALDGREASDVLGQLAADPAWQIMNEHGERLSYDDLPVPTALRQGREVRDATLGFPAPGRETRWARVTVVPVNHPDGSLRGAVVTLDDITERRMLAAQLAQAQKMEAIGQLAGGIAHDFNNLLTAILGNAELATMAAPPGSPLAQELVEIRDAALRGAALTGRVLTFARKQVSQPQIVVLDQLVASTQKLLARALGEQIVLLCRSGDGLWSVRVDPSEIEQVIINLAINARDAMPNGGELVVGAGNCVIDATQAAKHGVEPGEYVALSVRDTGVGIPPEMLGRVFEPFFTTKPVGVGTGLGLSICYGVARQSRGFITVESTVGVGSTFTLHLPRATEAPSSRAGTEERAPLGKGRGTILVAEDEESVRTLVGRMLSRDGYKVLTATSGADALSLQARTPDELALLITDVVMPTMRGPEVATAMRRHQPNLPVLFLTGYTGVPSQDSAAFGKDEVLKKPFTAQQLLAAVRRAIAAASQPGPRAPDPPIGSA